MDSTADSRTSVVGGPPLHLPSAPGTTKAATPPTSSPPSGPTAAPHRSVTKLSPPPPTSGQQQQQQQQQHQPIDGSSSSSPSSSSSASSRPGSNATSASNSYAFFDPHDVSFPSFSSLESASTLPSLPSFLDPKDKEQHAGQLRGGNSSPASSLAADGMPRQGTPTTAQQSRPQQSRPVVRGQPVQQQQQQQQQHHHHHQQQQPPSPGQQQSHALVSAQSPETKRIINPVTVPNGQNFVDITEYLNMPQSEAAKKLGIPPSTLSKRWKEAVRNRKWPWRVVCKLDKEIMTLLHNVPQGAAIPEEIEGRLGYLMRKRQEELKPVVIRL